ncbi:protein of unknown function [Taphrina deformans PYCC 5710]|uniref:Major facilitator superfamily (MFS) profile domain-containing protein n=1 Tax=Taphrina deformans (strain PYCC 5710 / ATCC 11124 / CBS 356.35 / IMI 108563 / JCM 9778 / NBRC 8474) TaxID=1097556 RepID=R4XDL6_TAPDE|nr:protein of unknown function [Taphrina deformans PYCC 5710]|eukprot:CCG83696.1 protein of unknown function [Taphrina deformans PYCC 5710]
MGKSTSIFQRLGKGGEELPAQIFNLNLLIGVTIFGILGAARGFDEGNVSGMLAAPDFQKTFGLVKGTKLRTRAEAIAAETGNISAMVQLFSIVGGLGAFVINDRIGRVWSLRALCVVWIVGVVLQMTSHQLGQLYGGRAIAGLGIGATTVVGPVYLVEIAPRSIRGLCSGIFAGFVYIGIMLSYFATWGSSLHQTGRVRWVIPLSLQVMFAGMALLFSVFAIESPRYYMLKGKSDLAMKSLVRLRKLPSDHPFVAAEMRSIEDGLERERQAVAGKSMVARSLELFSSGANLYRLIGVGVMVQLLGQWSGANSITIYAPQYFALLGVKGQNEKLFATAVFGVVKFVASIICSFFLIDRIGRKRSLYLGVGIQFISMLYIAIFLAAAPSVAEGAKITSSMVKHAASGGVVMIYFNGFGWALGWNSVQYLLGTEIWPLHLRSLGSSIIMAIHFANQYGNSKSVPEMLLTRAQGGLSAAGTMFLFAAVCFLGLVYIYWFLPEASGHSLESLDLLFNMKWYKIGRYSSTLASKDLGAQNHTVVHEDDRLSVFDEKDQEKNGGVVMVEDSERSIRSR